MSIQGDLHNFRKFVSVGQRVVTKPRNVLWENLFLSSNSKVRNLIDQVCKTNGITSPFYIAPDLNFQESKLHSGSVERLKLAELNRDISSDEVQALAAMIALCYWFGIGDLHHENVSVGLNEAGTFVCFPIDIETIFEKMTHVRQTLLTPSSKVSASNCGLTKVLPQLMSLNIEAKTSFLISFSMMMNILNENSENILSEILKNEQINKYPIRMILRDTSSYRNHLEGKSELLRIDKAEAVQLNRDDIPYFFRYLNSDDINFYVDENNQEDAIGTDRSEFNLMSSVILTNAEQIDLIKTNTSILSLSYLAQLLDCIATNDSLTTCTIQLLERNLEFRIFENKINYAYI